MTVTVEWDNAEKKALRYSFVGSWRPAEAIKVLDEGVELMKMVPHKVDILMDFQTSPKFAPLGSIDLGKRFLKDAAPANTGTTVIIGSLFMNNLYSIIHKITGKNNWDTIFAKDLQEARSKLKLRRND